jgi:hypothetical protein
MTRKTTLARSPNLHPQVLRFLRSSSRLLSCGLAAFCAKSRRGVRCPLRNWGGPFRVGLRPSVLGSGPLQDHPSTLARTWVR